MKENGVGGGVGFENGNRISKMMAEYGRKYQQLSAKVSWQKYYEESFRSLQMKLGRNWVVSLTVQLVAKTDT